MGLVFVAEMGDKTQIMALLLAARFAKPIPIVLGMIVAVLANHLIAVGLGIAVADHVPEQWLRWGVAALFIGMAIWLLLPDKASLGEQSWMRHGAFLASMIAFFLAEMGDKTQIATVALAARYQTVVPVLAGSALGMTLADAPVIWLGERITRRLPTRLLHRIAAILFVAFGVGSLFGW